MAGNLAQLSAGEAFDDFNSQPLGEGFLTLRTSAGNRLEFRDPASMTAYMLNPAAGNVGGSDQAVGAAGSFNMSDQNPTTT